MFLVRKNHGCVCALVVDDHKHRSQTWHFIVCKRSQPDNMYKSIKTKKEIIGSRLDYRELWGCRMIQFPHSDNNK